MLINVKRFTIGAVLFASLVILLQGCGSMGGSPVTYSDGVSKWISGTVYDATTNKPVSGAKVTVYAVENGVLPAAGATPLSVTFVTDNTGRYVLEIPRTYTGSVLVRAVIPSAKFIDRLAKLLFLPYNTSNLRAVVPDNIIRQNSNTTQNLNFATEALVLFLEKNVVEAATLPPGFTRTGFSADNIRLAEQILETLFGPIFNETQLPQNPANTNTSIPNTTNTTYATKSEQDLLVSITAINIALNNPNSNFTLADIVIGLVSPGGLGSTIADAIKTAIDTATNQLINAGTLPLEYVPSAAINAAISNAETAPVQVPPQSDITPPSAPLALTATLVNSRTVRLVWTSSTDDSPAVGGGYLIYRADASGIYTLVDTIANLGTPLTSVTYIDPTIPAATSAATYTYKVIAFDAVNNLSVASNLAAVTVQPLVSPAIPPKPPTQPAGLVIIGYNATQVNLQWVGSSITNGDGSVVPASGYYVYRNDQIIATISGTTYIDTTVLPGTEYTYYIKAFDSNSSNVSAASIPLTIRTTNPVGTTPPAAPLNLALASVSSDKVALIWSASSTAGVAYNVYRGQELLATGITATQYSDMTVVPNTIYSYRVTAEKDNAESAPSNTIFVTVPQSTTSVYAPTVPTNFALVTSTSNSVVLTWAKSTMQGGPIAPDGTVVDGYDILRGDSTGSNFVLIATITPPSAVAFPGYTDTSVSPSTTYTYRVRAFSSNGTRSDNSTIITVKTADPVVITDTTPPTAPTNLGLNSPDTGTSVQLIWNPSTDNSGTVAGYRVYRDGIEIANVTVTSFADFTASANTSYIYTVRAYDNSGNLSAPSNQLFVTTPPQKPATYTLSGRITFNGIGLRDVTITIIGTGFGSVTTDANGNYRFTNVKNGEYTITPTRPGYFFTPSNQTVRVEGSDFTVPDFIAIQLGSVSGGVDYPPGTVVGGVTYPAGTIIGGITYPYSTVIGGVTYPTATVIGGVTYPTGTVIGGILYPNGVVIGGVTYPPGTVVGGIAFPPGTVVGNFTYPAGTVIGGVFYPSGTATAGSSYPSGTVNSNMTYPTGTVIGGVTYPTGRVVGGVNYPSGVLNGTIVYPSGSVIGGTTYPAGTIIGGITYPNSTVIGGVTYPTSTVIGGVTYPTGTVIGGILYPNGVVIGGVTYPAGTVVGGIAFPPGTVVGNFTYPTGTVIGGVTYPTGTVNGGAIYPSGTVIGTITYPSGTIIGGVTYPAGRVAADLTYPPGTIIGGITYPNSTVIGGVTYPTSTVIGGITYPTGTAVGGILYPNGVVIGGVAYPPGTVVGGIAFPPGTVSGGMTYPTGSISADLSYPAGTLTGVITYPSGSVVGGTTYPSGTIIGGITYPNSTVIGGVTYPTSTVIGGVTYPTGTVIGGITYPNGVVIGGVSYPAGTVVGGIAFPPGTVTGNFTYPTGTVIGGVLYPTGTVNGGVIYPSGTAIGNVTYPSGVVIGGIVYSAGRISAAVSYPSGTVTAPLTYPGGTVVGGATYPTGTVIGGNVYPSGTIIGGITYPNSTVVGGVTYPTSTVIGGITYPTGTVIGGILYPDGVVIGGITYPPGTVVGGIAFPPGTVTSGATYPDGTVIGGTTYPTGTVSNGAIYPSGTAIGAVSSPTGVVIGGVTYAAGTVVGGVTYPGASLTLTSLTYSVIIYGHVTDAGSGADIAGVTIAVSDVTGGGAGVPLTLTTTTFAGTYSFRGETGHIYRITPSLATYTFGPIADITVADNSANIAVNFSGTPNPI